MDKYVDLLRRYRALERLIAAAYESERMDAISRIALEMVEYNIGIKDIGQELRKRRDVSGARNHTKHVPQSRAKHVPKYMDPLSGRTWSGRGRRPNWMVGKNIEEFILA